MKERLSQLRQHWEQLQLRERRILLFGALAVVVMGLYVLIWEPLVIGRAELAQKVADQRALLTWMEQSSREVLALRSGRGSRKNTGQSLMSVVDRTARDQGLAEVLERVQPDGENAVRVWLTQASFDQSLRWLDKLMAEQGVRVTGLVAERGSTPGKADVRITLEGGV